MNDKRPIVLLELLHSFPSTLFLYGIPFYTKLKYGWQAGPNLLAQGLAGLCIALGAYIGGQIAHRKHPREAVDIALVGCLGVMALGWLAAGMGPGALLVALAAFAFSQAVGWPGIETLLVADESHAGVQHLVGIYNLTWSMGTATAFLAGPSLLAGFGPNVIFALPMLLYVVCLLYFRFGIRRRTFPPAFSAAGVLPSAGEAEQRTDDVLSADNPLPARSVSEQNAFRYLGWLANPLAYIAINVLVAYNPTISTRLHLSLAQAGIWLSLWFYSRSAAFEILRRWTWWRYRRGFLCGVFVATMASFWGIVTAVSVPMLLAAQVVFGLSTGLLYQSSLFYSMADSEAQGAHSGLHESFLGLGIMVGPLLAYAGARFAPDRPALPIWLVLGLMSLGLATLVRISLTVRSVRR